MILWMLACAVEEPPADVPPVESDQLPLDEPGPFRAGTASESISAPTGVDLLLQYWFPTTDTSTTTVNYDGLYPGGAIDGATPDCSEKRPVVVFSHGSGGVRWQSAFLTERLASHGYVVVAPDHTGNTIGTTLTAFPTIALRRPLDVRDSFDWLATSSPVADCIDEEAGYAVIGHSFGGYTAFVAGGATVPVSAYETICEFDFDCSGWDDWKAENPDATFVDHSDPRVWAVVPLAPWDAYEILGEGTSEIDAPSLVIGADNDQTTPMRMVRKLYRSMSATPRHLVSLTDSGHYSFAPISCLVYQGDGCGPAFRDAEEVGELVNDAVLPFLEIHRGNKAAESYFPPADDGFLIEEEAL